MARRPLTIIRVGIVLFALLSTTAYAYDHEDIFFYPHPFSNNLEPFEKWRAVVTRQRHQNVVFWTSCALSQSGDCIDQGWQGSVQAMGYAGRLEQLRLINHYFNHAKYISDRKNYGRGDFWGTAEELLSRGGDCEDFAIAKYFALREVGVSPADLRIVVFKDVRGNSIHAALLMNLDGTAYILDNQLSQVIPYDLVLSYRPIYAINETGWWIRGLPRTPASSILSAAVPASAPPD